MHVFFNKYKIFTVFENKEYQNLDSFNLSFSETFPVWESECVVHPHNETQQSNKACSVAFTEIDFWKHGEHFLQKPRNCCKFPFCDGQIKSV